MYDFWKSKDLDTQHHNQETGNQQSNDKLYQENQSGEFEWQIENDVERQHQNHGCESRNWANQDFKNREWCLCGKGVLGSGN